MLLLIALLRGLWGCFWIVLQLLHILHPHYSPLLPLTPPSKGESVLLNPLELKEGIYLPNPPKGGDFLLALCEGAFFFTSYLLFYIFSTSPLLSINSLLLHPPYSPLTPFCYFA